MEVALGTPEQAGAGTRTAPGRRAAQLPSRGIEGPGARPCSPTAGGSPLHSLGQGPVLPGAGAERVEHQPQPELRLLLGRLAQQPGVRDHQPQPRLLLGGSNSSPESQNTSPSPSSSSGDADSSLESQNTCLSPSSSSGDADSSLESQNTSSSNSSSLEDTHSSLDSGTTPAPGASHTVIPRPATEEDEDEDEEEEDEDGRPPEAAALLFVTKHLKEPGKV
ncbi:synapsin-1-like [Alligator mississippiensis]|uniref:synapsin-1-like n=1 Tax=Alligator mississippiensis TaxID=8496 RepID=UPI0028775362|nr:synapsin-1-like [Alligator mississippiensis]